MTSQERLCEGIIRNYERSAQNLARLQAKGTYTYDVHNIFGSLDPLPLVRIWYS